MARTAYQIASGLPLALRADYARERLEMFQDALRKDDWLAALRNADSFAAMMSDLLADIVQTAYNEGHTKADIARAFGVPTSQLRGMVRT
jgi:CENP-B N-terminal DNA-binding domain